MNRLARIGLTAWVLSTPAPARTELPLPAWDEPARKTLEKSGWLPGTRILTEEAETDPQQAPPPPPLEEIKPAAGELADTPATAVAIPEKFLTDYFGARPEGYLIDPQKLLDKQATRERQDFLQGHASDSAIDLFIYIFNKDQEIPGEVREEELIERFFTQGRPAMVVYYYLGAPQQAVLHLSPSLTERVTVAMRRQALQSAVMQATEKSNPQDQLEAFCAQLAIRIYWMERLLGDDASAGNGTPSPGQARAAKPAKKPESLAAKWAELRPVVEPLALPGLVLAGVLALAVGFLAWLRWRATYPFPEFAVEPRLGGAHAAGVVAVIGFSRTDPPPPSQRARIHSS